MERGSGKMSPSEDVEGEQTASVEESRKGRASSAELGWRGGVEGWP